MSVDFTPHAVFDIDSAADELELGRAGRAALFRDAARATFERLERLPDSAELYNPPSARYPGLRVAQISRYRKYAVYYQRTPEGVLVIRVLHTSRDAAAIFNPDPDPLTPPGA